MEKKICFGIITIIVVIVVILAGIYLSIKEPDVTVKSIRLKSLSIATTTASFYVTLNVHNDNILGATLKSVEADIYIDSDLIGNTYSEKEFKIKGNDVSEIEVVLTISDVPTSLLSKNQFEVQVIGTAYVKVAFSDFELPIDKTETISVHL